MRKTSAESNSGSHAQRLFKACSDPTRLRILAMLRGGELCVCDIAGALEVPQPKVSRHLSHLKKAGLVRARKDGLWIHYSLSLPGGPLHAKLLETLRAGAPLDQHCASDSRKLMRLKSHTARCR